MILNGKLESYKQNSVYIQPNIIFRSNTNYLSYHLLEIYEENKNFDI